MKVILAGGGTMGSVSPLIAIYEQIKKIRPEAEFLFLGTPNGPERLAVASYKIPFRAIASGKLRRYFSWQNFIDPWRIKWGFWQALFIIGKFRPNVVLIAGSFVGVGVAWAAWLWRVPVIIHQQDIIAGLANKLMANAARKITVSFEPSLSDYAAGKIVLIGNPVRQEFFSCDPAKGRQVFNLKDNLPVLLVLGGGTGSQKINDIVAASIGELIQFCQIIHITGAGKKVSIEHDGYQQFEFLTHEMTEALCAADLVVTRAGMSTLSELSILAKPAIIIPLADTHQEANARYFQKNNAALTLSETTLTPETFVGAIKELMFSVGQRENLARNIMKVMKPDGATQAAKLAMEMAK